MNEIKHLLRDRHIWGFSFYDFANSAYILIIHAFLFPIVFKEVAFGSSPKSDFYWGLAISMSVLIAILLGPIFGHRADTSNRKRFLTVSIVLTSVGLLAISSTTTQSIPLLYFVLFLIINTSFVLSQIIYDSFLPLISRNKSASVISGFSWGFGYLGGILCLIMLYALGATELDNVNIGLFVTGLFFITFSIVALILLPPSTQSTKIIPFFKSLKEAKLANLMLPLLAIWLINEAIDIFIFFGPLFAKSTFELSIRTVGVYLLLIQLIAFPATWYFGWLGKRIGLLRSISISIIIWIIVAIGTSQSQNTHQLLIFALLGALVIGSTQALLRAYYSNLTVLQHSGLSFGFYSLAARSSAIVGPLTYGVISYTTGSQRIAMSVTILPFFIGLCLLYYHHKKQTE